MTKKELKRKIQSHEYSWKQGETEHRHRIENELEAENYHALLKIIIDHEYKSAYEWIEKNI